MYSLNCKIFTEDCFASREGEMARSFLDEYIDLKHVAMPIQRNSWRKYFKLGKVKEIY